MDDEGHDFEFTIPINMLEPEQGVLRVRVRKRPGLDYFLEEVAVFPPCPFRKNISLYLLVSLSFDALCTRRAASVT